MKTDISREYLEERESSLVSRRDLSFYLVLFLVVLPFWSAVPFAWVFVIHSLRTGKIWFYSKGYLTLFAIALAEVFFSVYHFQLARQISPPSTDRRGDPLEIRAAFMRLLKAGLADLPEDGGDEESLDINRPGSPAESITQLSKHDPRAIDFRNSLRNWFSLAPWSSIKGLEIRKWLYWSMFNADMPPLEKMPPSHNAVLEEAVTLLESRTGTRFQEGSDPSVIPLRLTIDPTFINWRPVTFYALVGLINRWLRWRYINHFGAKYETRENLEYLLRVPKNWDAIEGPRPLVFVHGLGLGLLQYHLLIYKLFCKFTDRPIFILLQPQISQDVFHPRFLVPYTRQQTVDNLAKILVHLGWAHFEPEVEEQTGHNQQASRGVTMLSHSNGTYVHAWMMKMYPGMLARSCLVDPVTLCQWEGDVCYRFMYQPATTGFQLIMRYFVGSELGVANLLQRHFDWVSNTLWFEEIPNARDPARTKYFLGGKDEILNAERIKKYLTSHGVKKGLWYDPNGRHGQALLAGTVGHDEVFQWLAEPEAF